jgi:septal ring factor EnvC (AmiA/AmiB activator)
MAFKMSGFSAFTKTTDPFGNTKKEITEDEKKKIAENQDPGSGLSQVDELKSDMKHAQEQINETKNNLKNNPHDPNGDKEEKKKHNRWINQHNIKLSNLTRSLEIQKKDFLRFLSEKKMLPKP